MSTHSEPAKSCRHLVSMRDPASFFAYPSAVNACGRFEPPGELPASHQSRFCLTVRHASCPLLATTWTGPFPGKLEKAAESEWGPAAAAPRKRWGLMAIGGLAVLAIAGILWWTMGAGEEEAAQSGQDAQPPMALLPAQITPDASSRLEQLPLPLPTSLGTPPPTQIPLPLMTPTAGPGLEAPFGAEPPFLIHTVRAGDTLFALAEAFDSSPEAVRAANGLGEHTLGIGQLLVIPVGISDPAQVPLFLVTQVGEPGEPLADLAARYGVDPESVRRYNALGQDPMLPPGRWLIVPMAGAQ